MNKTQLNEKLSQLENLENLLIKADDSFKSAIQENIKKCKFVISEMKKEYTIEINGQLLDAKIISINNNDSFNCIVMTEKGHIYCELSKLKEKEIEEQLEIVGYFYDRNADNETSDNLKYIIAIVNSNDERKWIEGYNIMDGHFEIKDELWLSSCLEITKDEYLKGTKGFYTPIEYL